MLESHYPLYTLIESQFVCVRRCSPIKLTDVEYTDVSVGLLSVPVGPVLMLLPSVLVAKHEVHDRLKIFQIPVSLVRSGKHIYIYCPICLTFHAISAPSYLNLIEQLIN